MYITELKAGDEILIDLHKSLPAYPTKEGNVIIYKTGSRYKKGKPVTFSEGEGTVILNSNKVLVFRFAGRINPSFHGVAEVDYSAIQKLYIYEGETNADTVAEGLNNKQTAPAMKIYRKKVVLRWQE